MRFVDEVSINVEAGAGGDGCVAFRREKYVPRGGPAGGDGGNGGNVVLEADLRLRTLLDLRSMKRVKAKGGQPGRSKQMNGARGDSRVLRVPVGTLVLDDETGETIADLTEAGAHVVAAAGGHGGRGNMHFTSSTNQAPRQAESGTPGEQRFLRLELKLMADVGLLGFPNAGKSTLVSRISRARPKIADYPFTTLVPQLGVCALSDHRSFVVADLPGLVEGAAKGVGLGHRFLRHLERTAVLLHLVDPSQLEHGTALEAWRSLNGELVAYSAELAALPQVAVINKTDLPMVRDELPELEAAFRAEGVDPMVISAVTGEGVAALLEQLYTHVARASQADEEAIELP